MSWFRNLFRRPAGKRPAARPSFRPCLESLEDRAVPTISHAFLANGQVATLANFENGLLYEFSPTFTGVVATGVQDVHAYRDANGQLGMDIVFTNDSAYRIDSSGLTFLGTGVREASTTVDSNGNTLTLVAEMNGTVFAIRNGSISVLGTHFYSACTYLDANGNFGYLLDYQTGSNSKLLIQVDSTQNRVIGPGFEEAESNYGPNGRFYLDLTRDNGTAFEFTQAGVQVLGTVFDSPPSS